MQLLRVILSCYVFVWLTFVVPSHTRGKITIPDGSGDATIAGQVDSCCAIKLPASGKSESKTPTSDERKRCAVCYAVACFMPAPPLPVFVQFHSVIQLTHDRAAAQVSSLDYPTPFWPGAPPRELA